VSGWLVDKSAFLRIGLSAEVELWNGRIDRGLVAVTTLTLLEVGFSARSGESWRSAIHERPIASMPLVSLTPSMEARAVEVQGLLAERGHHRAAKVPDLLIAAAAEIAGLAVLHVDKDFELIAAVTGQFVERLTGDF
jgi:predicted nucleic acid-binding protein